MCSSFVVCFSSKKILVVFLSAGFTLSWSPLTSRVGGSVSTAASTTFGAVTPTSYTASGLPPGLSIGASAVISGTPTTPGTYTVSVTGVYSSGGNVVLGGLTMSVQGE